MGTKIDEKTISSQKTDKQGSLTDSQKTQYIDKQIRTLFTITEEKDEFLGVDKVTWISDPIFESSFYDARLAASDFSAMEHMSDADLLKLPPAISTAEYLSVVDCVMGNPVSNTVIEQVDQILLNHSYSNQELQADMRAGMSAEELAAKYITKTRKELLLDAENYLCQLATEEARKRGKVRCSLAEVMDNGQPQYYIVFTIETASGVRSFKDFKAYAILPSGERMVFDGVQIYQENKEPTDEGINSRSLMLDLGIYIMKKYKFLVIDYWKKKENSLHWYTFSERFFAPLSEMEFNGILSSGARFSVRFDGYDVRAECHRLRVMMTDRVFKYLHGDTSKIDWLYGTLQNLEKTREEDVKRQTEWGAQVLEMETAVDEKANKTGVKPDRNEREVENRDELSSVPIDHELPGNKDEKQYESQDHRSDVAVTPLIKEAESLKKEYLKSLSNNYVFTRYEAIYKSGYVIAEINANEVTDVGFYNNPDLENQFMPSVGGRGGSGIMGALQEAAADSYAEKKMHEDIEKASKESMAKMVLYAVSGDPVNFKMDIVFFNRSKNREMNNPGLLLESEYKSSEIKGITHKNGAKNKFEDVLTVSLPFDYLYSINNKEATFVFDQEENDGNDAVYLKFKVRYDLMDLICVDYLVRGGYWDKSRRDRFEPLFLEKTKLFKQSEQINTADKADTDTENKYKGIGCVASLVVLLTVGAIMSEVIYLSEDWSYVIGIVLAIITYIQINKRGKKKTKESREDSASKTTTLRKDTTRLSKEFETAYKESMLG